ncbi:Hypothetical predicted protein [Mytilus galloprovincialis]|uniref:DZANK-type domain-containing protein n=1 Tax=Mytilus galloprovincialis TaxID=29158 RepID=A0A8B6GZ37_MYTGA|nr:Hypothetical predicted protein [Mytilus galloprovincialis]
MKCLKELCGAEIPNGARFCTECKTEVQTTVSNKKRLCPSCNNIVLENYKFCSCCAWKVDPDLFIDRVCSGTKDDGQKCKTVLTSYTKFCPYCGTPKETPYTLIDKAGPNWVNQKTGEPQDSEQAGLVDEKFPDLKYQQRVTTEGSGLSIPIAKEDPDCIDRQISLEPKGGRSFKIKCSKELCGAEIPNGARCCTECKTEVQTTVSDKTILCPSCNKIVLEKYKFCSCCRWKVDPDLFIDRECSGTKDDGQKCKTMLQSSTKVSPYCGTPQDTPYTLKIKDEPLEPSSQITRESTIMNIKKECTQTRTKEPGDIPSSSNVHVCQMKRTHGPEFALADTCSKRRKESTSANNVTTMNSVDKTSLSLITTTGTFLADSSTHASKTAVIVSVLIVVIAAALIFIIVVFYRRRKIAKNSNSYENRQKHFETGSINSFANKTGTTDINMPAIYENINDNKTINHEANKQEGNYDTFSTNRKSDEHMNASTEQELTEPDLSQYQSLTNPPESDIYTYASTEPDLS